MISLLLALPLVVAAVLALAPRLPSRLVAGLFIGTAAAVLALMIVMTAARPVDSVLAFEKQLEWLPGTGSSYHVGVDGLSLPLLLLTAVIFLGSAIWVCRDRDRSRQLAALFLFLEATCLGLFAAQDLILFFLFFDLSIVGMYFAIAGWGHGTARRSALTFFLYTFLGSLVLLLGFIGLYLAADPHTFDMPTLAAEGFGGGTVMGGLVLLAVGVGLAIKTPTVPFHSWLPPAHTDAPTIGSVVLAAVLLKMGTYGFVRIAMPMLPQAWTQWGWLIVIVGIVSVLYGALVALAQTDLKRLIAYTSINHMGYVILAVGAAGVAADSGAIDPADAATLAITGAVTQMVSHGLLTGALFFLAGVMYARRGTYDMSQFGGLASIAPRYAALFAVAAFGSLGIPGISGFVAEFQIFAGSIAVFPWAAVALPGILLTAALLLRALQRVFTGEQGRLSAGFADVSRLELGVVAGLLVLAVAIGIVPAPLLDIVRPAAASVAGLLGVSP